MVAGTEVQVDGASAEVIDLSVIGAQIVSPSALRPQQRVRITLADDGGVVRINAAVAWASFEIPKSTPRYRAGIEFYRRASRGGRGILQATSAGLKVSAPRTIRPRRIVRG